MKSIVTKKSGLETTLFNDGCGYQNRTVTVANAILYGKNPHKMLVLRNVYNEVRKNLTAYELQCFTEPIHFVPLRYFYIYLTYVELHHTSKVPETG